MIKPGELNKKNKQNVDFKDDPNAEVEVVSTPLVLGWVLDESGSMESLRDTIIDGFNEYLNANKKNNLAQFILTRLGGSVKPGTLKPIAQCDELSRANYRPDGGTPLYDAIKMTIEAIDAADSVLPRLVVILTDGMNNTGSTTLGDVRKLIEEKTATGLWTFVYVGANQDAWARSADIGVAAGNTRSWQPTVAGAGVTTDSLLRMSNMYTSNTASGQSMSNSAFADAGEDTCLVCGDVLDPNTKHNCAGAPKP